MHVHLDPAGGLAGDMFVAALLDTWPEYAPRVLHAVSAAGLCPGVDLSLIAHHDGVLKGSRFLVSLSEGKPHQHAPDQNHDHGHNHWSDLRRALTHAPIEDAVKAHAIGIFERLATAEAEVHGVAVDDVVFHEVGNWDSIADIVAAAALIDAVGAESWSVASLPIGRGRVATAHGDLPVPAPATSLLLKGFPLHDDGRSGERVTPTGAAILAHLAPQTGIGARPRVLARTGNGFGTRRLEGMSNVLRVLAFKADARLMSERISILEFEIDDQTSEDLALALDHIRAMQGVRDVTQGVLFGKKGRLMTAVRVLVDEAMTGAVTDVCFRETTTLGIRHRSEERSVLARREVGSEGAGRVKIAARPGGDTAKADLDDVASTRGHSEREKARRAAAHAALEEGSTS